MRKQHSFRHPVDIRHDDRIADLVAVHGHAGYGVYWMILEILHSQESMQVPYDVKTIRRMAAQVGMPHEEFHNLLQDMIHDYDLFEIADWQPDTDQPGFIRSTIIYRKPRKQKVAVTTRVETSDTDAPDCDNINSKEPANTKTVGYYEDQRGLSFQSVDLVKDLHGPPVLSSGCP